MTLYDTLLAIQYVSILGLFVESFIVIKTWRNKLHTLLAVSCFAVLINTVGYLFEFNAMNLEEYLTAVQISYLGRVWYGFFMFLFIAELCRVKVPKVIKYSLCLFNAVMYGVILTLRSHNLFYDGYTFELKGQFASFWHGDGIFYKMNIMLQISYAFFAIVILIATRIMESNRVAQKCITTVTIAIFAEVAFLIAELIGIPGLKDVYDVTMLGYFIGTIFMLVGILSFDLLKTRDIAKEFVIDRISEGIIAVDSEGIVQYYNEPARKLYPELESANAKLPEEIKRAIDDKGNIVIGDRIYMPEINELTYREESFGKLYALVDETEHYRYMRELEEQKEIADFANEAKSRFLANMSHEIRTPINAVLGMDEMILRESSEKPIRSYAADIMSAGKSLLSIINDILDLSKVEEGKMEIIPVQYELSSVVNDLVNMVRGRADKKGLKLNVEVDKNTPDYLYGDEIRVKQCALNLLTNAVKYTNEGSVTFKLASKKMDDDNIYLTFTVIDTGVGISKEDMEKLFAPYNRIDEKRNRHIEGTGLGMSITRQLLELMESELEVTSEYGSGSTFEFTVRQGVVKWEEIGDYAERIRDGVNADYDYHELFHAPDAKILVIDDNETNLMVINSLLKRTGIKIDTALSGREGIELAKKGDYDIIFIDHMMPEMDGIETLNHIREISTCDGVPAIALTANAVSGAREKYLEAGFNNYLAKPVGGDKLEKVLYNTLPKEKIQTSVADNAKDASNVSAATVVDPDDVVVGDVDLLFDKIGRIDAIDAETGAGYCGSTESYISVITVFYQTIDDKADEIEDFYNEEDYENYTIKVHALKSSARIIGYGELSKLAESLENAGKENDVDYIKANTERLLDMYRDLKGRLHFLEADDDDREEISPKAMKEAYQTVYEVASCMEYEMLDDMLKELKKYKFNDTDEANVRRIEKLLTELDWDGIIKLVDDILHS